MAQGLTLSPKLIYFEPIRAKLLGIKKMQLVHTSMVYVWSVRTFFMCIIQAGLVAYLPNYVSRILAPWLLIIHCKIRMRIKWWNVCEPSLHIRIPTVNFSPS